MRRDFLSWLGRPRPRQRQRRRSRAAGCLLWLLVLVVVLVVVALLFGGFRRGTPASGAGPPVPMSRVSCSPGAGGYDSC
jgi:heme A synthase